MKITIEPTDEIFAIIAADNLFARVWTGTIDGTDPPVEIHVYVAMVSPQTNDPEILAAFNRDLYERPVDIVVAADPS